jgi:hypothetical protein
LALLLLGRSGAVMREWGSPNAALLPLIQIVPNPSCLLDGAATTAAALMA